MQQTRMGLIPARPRSLTPTDMSALTTSFMPGNTVLMLKIFVLTIWTNIARGDMTTRCITTTIRGRTGDRCFADH